MESLWFSSASVCYVLHPVNYRKRAGKLEIIFSPDYFQLPPDRRKCGIVLSYLASFRCKALRQFIPRGSLFKKIRSNFFFFNYKVKIKILPSYSGNPFNFSTAFQCIWSLFENS